MKSLNLDQTIMSSLTNWIGSEEHRIRVNEIGPNKKATLPALVNLMQEVAWNNSHNLKYSVYDLIRHGVTWVVYRMQIHINRYPNQQETVTVQSWPSGMDRLYTYRDYKIIDSSDNEIVRATSAWLVMDIKKRELVSVPGFIREGLAFDHEIERIELDRTKLKAIDEPRNKFKTCASFFNMDQNGHVYNTYYFEWLLECMTEEIKSGRQLKYIDIQFKGESRDGDDIIATSAQGPENLFYHQIVNSADVELIRAISKW